MYLAVVVVLGSAIVTAAVPFGAALELIGCVAGVALAVPCRPDARWLTVAAASGGESQPTVNTLVKSTTAI